MCIPRRDWFYLFSPPLNRNIEFMWEILPLSFPFSLYSSTPSTKNSAIFVSGPREKRPSVITSRLSSSPSLTSSTVGLLLSTSRENFRPAFTSSPSRWGIIWVCWSVSSILVALALIREHRFPVTLETDLTNCLTSSCFVLNFFCHWLTCWSAKRTECYWNCVLIN